MTSFPCSCLSVITYNASSRPQVMNYSFLLMYLHLNRFHLRGSLFTIRSENCLSVNSLAVILWELWYGEDSADHISTHLFGRLEDAIKNGLRPSVTMSQKPPDDWIKLLQSGWEYEAARRPSVKEVAEFFERFLRDNPS